jgi:transcriptional regulator with XRE-family HTH domain
MDLSEFRAKEGLSLDNLAKQLGLRSKSYLSEVERGRRPSLKVAIKIEKLSGGQVTAASLCPDAAGFGVAQ